MSRPFSRMKLGYYPLPVEETQNIRTLLKLNEALMHYSELDQIRTNCSLNPTGG
jgi:hypothetical protein